MAYLAKTEEEAAAEAAEKGTGQPRYPGNPYPYTPGAPTTPGGLPGAVGASGPNTAPGGGKFINFDRYFAANADAAQGMAQGLTGAADKQGADASAAINKAEVSASNDVSTARDLATSQTGVRQETKAVTTPTRQLRPISPEEMEKVKRFPPEIQAELLRQYEADPNNWEFVDVTKNVTSWVPKPTTYGGPTGIAADKVDELNRGISRTQDATGLLQRESGVEAALQKQHGYGAGGKSRFDTALTGTAGRGQFAALQQKYANLGGALGEAQGRVGRYATAAQGIVGNANAAATADAAGRNQRDAAAAAAAAAEAEKKRHAGESDTTRRRREAEAERRRREQGGGTYRRDRNQYPGGEP
jgi:hypothetical protein